MELWSLQSIQSLQSYKLVWEEPWEEELQQQDISFYEGLDKYIQSLKLLFMDIKH